MARNVLGKVVLTPKGDWENSIEYEALDFVVNTTDDGGDGCGYVALKSNVNVRPGSDPTVWRKVVERGSKGDTGSDANVTKTNIETALGYTPANIEDLNNKQDVLVSGSSIKTINGASILGSGNIEVQTSITTDSTPTSGSTNPVESGGVYTALQGKQTSISTVNVSVDSNTGTPSATASVTGDTMSISFSNLKGGKGDTGATPEFSIGTVSTLPEGSQATVSISGTTDSPVLNIGIPTGATGAQGNTGSSVDYPYELVNNVTTNDATKGLSAAQGVVLEEKISQLGLEVDGFITPPYTLIDGAIGTNGTVGTGSAYKHSSAIPVVAGQVVKVTSAGYNFAVISKDVNGTYTPIVNISSGDANVPATFTWIAPEDMNISVSLKSTIAYSILVGTPAANSISELDLYSRAKFVPVDMSQLSWSAGSLGANSNANSRWVMTGTHIAIPVTPGEMYRLRFIARDPVSGTTGGFYGFFTNYTAPTEDSSAVYYSTQSARQWLNFERTIICTIPSDTYYLIICTRDGGAHNVTWSVEHLIFDEVDMQNLPNQKSDKELSFVELDISLFPSVPYCLSATNWMMGNPSKQSHIAIPVTPGEIVKFFISKVSGNTGTFYSFVDSNYTPPVSASAIPFAIGWTRKWADKTYGWISEFVPDKAAYLILNTYDAASATITWKVCKSITDTVNVSKNYIYAGPFYDFSERHSLSVRTLMNLSNNTSPYSQGGDSYGKYFFQFVAENSLVRVYDLESGELIDSAEIDSENRGFVSNAHCNTVNFSNKFYDPADIFPLVYVSTGYTSGGYSGALVYRIQQSGNSFTFTLVQTIKFPASLQNTLWTEIVVAGENIYARYTTKREIYQFQTPSLSEGTEVIMDISKALNVYNFAAQPDDWADSANQGCKFWGGKIFALTGSNSTQKRCLFVLDLASRSRECVIDLPELGLTSEPETLFIYNGHLCVAFIDYIVEFTFGKEVVY